MQIEKITSLAVILLPPCEVAAWDSPCFSNPFVCECRRLPSFYFPLLVMRIYKFLFNAIYIIRKSWKCKIAVFLNVFLCYNLFKKLFLVMYVLKFITIWCPMFWKKVCLEHLSYGFAFCSFGPIILAIIIFLYLRHRPHLIIWQIGIAMESFLQCWTKVFLDSMLEKRKIYIQSTKCFWLNTWS